MADAPSRKSLLRARALLRQKAQDETLSEKQWRYVRHLLSAHRRSILWVFAAVFCLTVLEVCIPLFVHLFVERAVVRLDVQDARNALAVLAGILAVYIGLAYWSIRTEKTVITLLINAVRRQWVKRFLHRPLFAVRAQDRGNILVKVTYHLSLLQMGIKNTAVPLVQAVLLTAGLVAVTFVLNTRLLVLVLALIPVNIALVCIGYCVSRYYASREQTLYSGILRFIADTASEFPLVAMGHREQTVLHQLDAMVELDTHVRIRRELWMQLGNRIVFAAITLVLAIGFIVEMYYPFVRAEHAAEYLLLLVVGGLCVQLLHQSLRVGLFWYPLQLGLMLCISQDFPVRGRSKLALQTTCSLQAKKIQLAAGQPYNKDVAFQWKQGQRILITAPERSGKTTLARVLSGTAPYSLGAPWIFKNGQRRLTYKQWMESQKDIYLIDPQCQTQALLWEVLHPEGMGLPPDPEELEQILTDLQSVPELHILRDHARSIGQRYSTGSHTFADSAILHLAACLLRKPEMIVVDNAWIDMRHDSINTLLQHVAENLPDTTLVIFAQHENSLIPYDQIIAL